MSGAQVVKALREHVDTMGKQDVGGDHDDSYEDGFNAACDEIMRLLVTLTALTSEDKPQ